MKTTTPLLLTLACSLALAGAASAQFQGPSTGSTPYVLPINPNPFLQTTSIFTTDNTGATPDDQVGGYGLAGIPDGLGAYDNGNGTFTLLVNQEIGNTLGVTRAHGKAGAFVSEFVINKNTFAVTSGADLMTSIIGWNSTTQASNTTPTAGGFAFNRFCSADLAPVSAYSFGGLGTTERLFMHGEEGGSTGYQQATVATGTNKGTSYTLGKFNLTTNGSGLTGVGAWENSVANPLSQLQTIVASGNDGGTGIMTNAVSIYVGTKTSTGSEVDKAGLTNGSLFFVNVTGNALEIPVANANSRVTNITSGTPFTLSSTASTTFSRPEDICWDPSNPSRCYFVTTDRLDQVSDGIGSQIGSTRLWALDFANIANPTAGGTIQLLIDGDIVDGKKVNMFDNLTVAADGMVFLQEDVGGAAHNGKVFQYDPASDKVTSLLKHDPARFGDIGLSATSPFNNDEETSGIIDITALMAGSALNSGLVGERWFLSSDQAHYTNSITAAQVEGGQLFAIHVVPEPTTAISLIGGLGMLLGLRRRRS